MNSAIESEVEVEQEKATKHAVGDTLRDVTKAVAVVEQDIAGDTITKYYLSIGGQYAEVLPDQPRGTSIKRHTLMKRLDAVDDSNIEITFQDQLTPAKQRHIAERVAPLRKEADEQTVSDDADDFQQSKPPEREYPDNVRDKPGEHLDSSAGSIDNSNEHGGGY